MSRGSIIEAALPWVQQQNKPFIVRVAFAVEPFMIRNDVWQHQLLVPSSSLCKRQFLADLPDRFGKHGWLCDTTGGDTIGRVGAYPASPELSIAAVFWFVTENHVWQHAITPLAFTRLKQFGLGAVDINMAQANRYENSYPITIGAGTGFRLGWCNYLCRLHAGLVELARQVAAEHAALRLQLLAQSAPLQLLIHLARFRSCFLKYTAYSYR
ncbi:hypothetical protein IPL68_00050 [Candidatus Saccharibacteria bacterium]|nr:MAG: hypothetical protein IPL68_00050 [Candidatus Saccharibacteria bacterium]